MALEGNYTNPQEVKLSDMKRFSIEADKMCHIQLNDYSQWMVHIVDSGRWATYTAAQRAAFKYILKDLMKNSVQVENPSISMGSVTGDF
jgi:hypothetical protein